MIQLFPTVSIEAGEVKFDKNSFLKFNPEDKLGLFNDKLKRISESLGRIDPSATSLFDYDEYVRKLLIKLFTKYHYLVLTERDCLFGVLNDQRYLIKSHLKGWYQEAIKSAYFNS
jgi:hypothetical protein